MIGTYDFCAHYEWTFAWLDKTGGHPLVRQYWDEAINKDSQRHARELILGEGFEGMAKYWGHTLAEESPEMGFSVTKGADFYRVDMHDCPSKGFLIRNKLQQYPDYCDHCMGWIGPMLKEGGYVVDHEHNHCGQCWWELRRAEDKTPTTGPGVTAGQKDIRYRPEWTQTGAKVDRYEKASDPDEKATVPATPAGT